MSLYYNVEGFKTIYWYYAIILLHTLLFISRKRKLYQWIKVTE